MCKTYLFIRVVLADNQGFEGLHRVHAKNMFAGGFIPFLVLGFWNKNTGIYAGAMPYRRDFPVTTGI